MFPKNTGTPKWMVYNGNPIKMDDLGGSTIFGSIQMENVNTIQFKKWSGGHSMVWYDSYFSYDNTFLGAHPHTPFHFGNIKRRALPTVTSTSTSDPSGRIISGT